MKNINIWQKSAIEPTFGMPMCAPTSGLVARPRVDAARVTGLAVHTGITGPDAWSPPIS
ncbi:hypothetical protein [Nocardioides currus]|nr:hypothetical protein [Nocardioides currus]